MTRHLRTAAMTAPLDTAIMTAPLDTATLERFYLDLCRVRRFDERVIELFYTGIVKGTAHSCVGQEAIAVGACAALRPDDFIVSHHRGHGHCIAKGAEMPRMMAELLGRETGYCGGLGGSMHIAALDRGILGANGVVGAGIGLGAGAALSAAIRGGGQVALAFFGDGAANEGIFHEACNIAALWKLPLVLLCENNRYGLSTPMALATAIPRIADRASAYGMPGETIDGNDVGAVHEAVARAVARARAGEGPSLIEALTFRWGDHSMRANLPRYRDEAEEREAMRSGDAIARLGEELRRRQVPGVRLDALRADAAAEVEAAITEAEGAAEPAEAALAPAVLAPHPDLPAEPGPAHHTARELSMTEAINEALAQEMARDARVVLLGEDIGRIGGIFGCTRGLQDRFGAARVRDTPISEAAIASMAVGGAITGLRPVVEIQIFDFVTLMMDAIVNQAAKFRFMLGGRPSVPVVFRGPQGGGIRLGAQHSQSLEAWFTHIPGLVVMAPSSPYDAKGLLASAIRDDNPVVFLEHKLLYVQSRGPVPTVEYAIPVGRAATLRTGGDVTILATMAMVPQALKAASELARQHGIEAEVIDPRTLRPLDLETIIASVRRTGRLVVAQEGWTRWGFGAEVVAAVVEAAFDWLDAPPERVGMRDVPMPYNDTLERAVIPGAAEIVAAARRAVHR
ncbi:MAG TPA: dehydrogenase E1 component subunit alpha/beta [Falsiroseomonas sp.]|jgi:2-oxoisovalerate dehydrogenase E1 component|nr:dehydrogenase E1 component subunit alpha/beta [Falsiroseomonas sp.]